MKLLIIFFSIAIKSYTSIPDYKILLNSQEKKINFNNTNNYFSNELKGKDIYFGINNNSNLEREINIKDNLNLSFLKYQKANSLIENKFTNYSDLLSRYSILNYNKIKTDIFRNSITETYDALDELCKFQDPKKIHTCVQLILSIFDFFITNTNFNLIYDYIMNDQICQNGLFSLTENNYKNLSLILTMSGKSLQDYGLEDECEEQGFIYYLIKIRLNETVFLNDEGLMLMNEFLGLHSFSVGFCFIKNCHSYIEQFFNSTANPQFYEYIKKASIIDISLFSHKKEEYSITFIYFFGYFFSTYIMFKFICTFFGLFVKEKYGSRKNSEYSKNSLQTGYSDDEDKSSSDKVRDQDLIKKKKRKPEKKVFQNSFFSQDGSNEIIDNSVDEEEISQKDVHIEESKKNTKRYYFKKKIINVLYFFYDFFSINRNLWHITERKNNYYNDDKLQFICYCKSVTLFFFTFNHIFYSAVILPHRDYFNLIYFTSIYFGFFKLTIFAADSFIALEALTFSYKLMSYLKKNQPRFTSFLKFYLFSLPKIILFLIIYFFFLIQFKNFGVLIDKGSSTFNWILIEKYKKKECFSQNQYLIFDIFYFCLSIDDESSFLKCFRCAYVYINLFLCFNFFMFLFYSSFKLKKKTFDITISLIILIGNMFSFVLYDLEDQNNYNFGFILGESMSFKHIMLFINKYFYGVLAGLFYFYSNETVLTNSIINSDDFYLPFSFIYDYIIFINLKKNDLSNTEIEVLRNSKTDGLHTRDNIPNINDNNKSLNNIGDDYRKSYINNIQKNKFPESFEDNKNNIIINNHIQKKINNFTKLKNYLKNIFINSRKMKILIFSYFMIFILGFYSILKFILFTNPSYDKMEILKFTWELKFLYIYERNIFLLSFIFIITSSSLTKNASLFKTITDSKLFLLIGRWNMSFFCMMESIAYIFFIVYDIEFYFSYQNVFFITVGISVLVSIFSFFMTYLFELPFRKAIKLIHEKMNESNYI